MAQAQETASSSKKSSPHANTAAAPANVAGRKKVSVRSLKLSEQEVGFTFRGIYRGQALGQTFNQVDQRTGEMTEKRLTSVILEAKDGTRTAYLADKGLLGNLADALVVEGQLIEVVKLDKQNIGKGRTMNAYDVFALDSWEV